MRATLRLRPVAVKVPVRLPAAPSQWARGTKSARVFVARVRRSAR
jgi:hypothetical protein